MFFMGNKFSCGLLGTPKEPVGGTKGLTNAPGENNCFLNSAIQILWNLNSFRNNFRQLEGHYCLDKACIFCAMKVLFTQYEYSEQIYLPPDVLRNALADFYSYENRFSLGKMGDAAEAFENILKRIHSHLIPFYDEFDLCNKDYCISHTNFSMIITEKIKCRKCHTERAILKFSQMTYYINSSSLIHENSVQELLKEKLTYGQLIKNSSKSDENVSCPNGICGRTAENIKELNNCPDIVTIGITWESNTINNNTMNEFYKCIDTSFEIQDLFDQTDNLELVLMKNDYRLNGLICYYGRHYTAFCFSNKCNEWIYMSDTFIEKVGPLWENVVEKCKKNRFQPYLLFYCSQNPSIFNAIHAPKETKILNKDEMYQ